MKVFISQPMDGKSERMIGQQKLEAEEWLQKYLDEDVVVVDAYIKEEAPARLKYGQAGLWYMAQSIKKLSECDAILLIGDWWNSRGCRLECKLAQEYELPVIVKEMPRF